jgi:hypothetical protein
MKFFQGRSCLRQRRISRAALQRSAPPGSITQGGVWWSHARLCSPRGGVNPVTYAGPVELTHEGLNWQCPSRNQPRAGSPESPRNIVRSRKEGIPFCQESGPRNNRRILTVAMGSVLQPMRGGESRGCGFRSVQAGGGRPPLSR